MSDNTSGHQSTAGSPNPRRDRRNMELTEHLFSHNQLNAANVAPIYDPYRTLALELFKPGKPLPVHTGMIVYSLPFCNWYRVQLNNNGGTLACTMGDSAGFLPLGPKTATVLPPGSLVVIVKPAGRRHGIIVAAYPAQQYTSQYMLPDWIVQGSQTGIRREVAYRQVLTNMANAGTTNDFSAGRPLDSTTLEWGKMTELGTGLHVDPFLLFMRVSEMCGIWLNYWDQHLRLAGMALDIQNPAFEITARNDEGEPLYIAQHNPYLWESLGMYKHGEQIHAEFDAEAVQSRIAKGKIDLADGEEDVQPISRYQEFGGYLGQGHKRLVMVPAKIEGVRYRSDDAKANPDMGVFEESIALDGSYMLRSAKQVMLLKHSLIPVPKQMQLPEDQKTGDDARKDNYKFAGTFGTGGKEHKVGDIDTTALGENRHLLTTAGIADLIAYSFNWKGMHPFHYHQQDYVVPDEQDLTKLPRAPGKLVRAQDQLDFAELAERHSMSAPEAKAIKVDDRYGEVDYFQRTAGIALLDDGGITIFDGYGASITLAGGHVRIDAPGDVVLTPGRNLVAFGGDDIVLRAKRSLDATAGGGDLRLKAENNLQILGGNSGMGGVLIESKADGFAADFENKIGEDVISGGVIIKAPRSSIVNWCGSYYCRTGSDGSNEGKLAEGGIIFDAAKGKQSVVMKASSVATFANLGIAHYVGPRENNSTVKAAYSYGQNGVVFSKSLTLEGNLFAIGNLATNGFIAATGGVGSVNGSGLIGKIEAGDMTRAVTDGRQTLKQQVISGQEAHTAIFPKGLYATGQAGNDRTIDNAAFSLRDDEGQEQYNTQQFTLTESRWQQMARLGEGSGGVAWDEPSVTYQGRKQLPYPGYDNWTGDTLLRLESLQLYDPTTGCSKPRADAAYENPSFAAAKLVSPSKEFKTIR